jgi:hypothetical protein
MTVHCDFSEFQINKYLVFEFSMACMNFKSFSIFLSLIGLLFASDSLAGSKIDTIFFQNGDRLTGEVKSLENNQLKLSTDDAKTINVEWSKVDSVIILNNMRIVLEDGTIMYGKILTSGEAGKGYIWASEGDPALLELIRIVSLSLLEDRFFKRLKGTLSSGFSYVKASQVMQLSLNGSIDYQTEKNMVNLSYDGIFTQDPNTGYKQNQSGGTTFFRFLPKNWFLVSSLTLESNSELQLDLRTSLSMGGGNSIVNSNSTRLFVALGIQATRELSTGGTQNNLEGLVAANYSVFIYDDPEVSFSLSPKMIPSLSNLGRVRFDIDSNLKWEIFNDFYLKWTFFYNFDNQPLTEGAEKKDWAVTLLGVEYKL